LEKKRRDDEMRLGLSSGNDPGLPGGGFREPLHQSQFDKQRFRLLIIGNSEEIARFLLQSVKH